jgi:uncharacterized membrane protein
MQRIEAYVVFALIVLLAMCALCLPLMLLLRKKGIHIIRQCGCIALFWSASLIVFGPAKGGRWVVLEIRSD